MQPLLCKHRQSIFMRPLLLKNLPSEPNNINLYNVAVNMSDWYQTVFHATRWRGASEKGLPFIYILPNR